ncbi:membrane protein insertase YidC [Parvularcula flava]|uniref:Membrane protein insertase YidC n=1 Tax=Aquisalinus luteolus TaxID=1566827 RepID=A0A8J3A0D3_9PROT|nr:membrane protein insertase YidC [Aquisalinus luteolus]NHK26646.1 membrane protein insertase YidC [Aquisalinus luteolus]GGH92976.1 membrane protein insertase YidC [Aquisalinus luteolus]
MDNRNLIIAVAVSMGLLLLWDVFYMQPQRDAMEAQRQAQQAMQVDEQAVGDLGTLEDPSDVNRILTREEALALAPGRVRIDTPMVTGSINLQGAVIDDLSLKQYHETPDESSPIVIMLNPRETQYGHYMQTGAIARAGDSPLQDDRTAIWTAPEGAVLTVDNDVTLTRTEGGLVHTMTIGIDDQYMFDVTRTVENTTGERAIVAPFGLTVQRGDPPFLRNFMILHEGPVGVLGSVGLKERKYNNVYKKEERSAEGVSGGWVGLTSKNWLAAAIPDQSLVYRANMGHEPNTTRDNPVYRSQYRGAQQVVEPGETWTYQGYMFGGAKRMEILNHYEEPVEEGGLGVLDFDKAVDWGNFFFLTRPIFWLMHFFAELTGNYGVAILLLTLVIKAVLFPLANKSYASMAGMRKVQPELKKLQERYKDDKMKQQQEMMALYKKYNINPLAGCLPVIMQMPIFFALYKVLFVTIELRHEPFLYIQDLTAPDPAVLLNLFGLAPWDVATIPVVGTYLAIGLLPILMAIAMFFQTKLNPPPPDPTQAMIFNFMPLIFLFIFAPFPAGLVLYWFWNTFLGVIQQYVIMKRHGADVDIFGNIKQSFGKNGEKKPASANDSK